MRRAMLPLGLHRLALRAAYRLLQVWWFVARPHTQGVKLVIRADDEILFVRHTYGRPLWELPGGGRRRDEDPEDAARREAQEELGLSIDDWVHVGELVAQEHATAHLICLEAAAEGRQLRLQHTEIAEARWCRPSAPPQPLGDHATAILELIGEADPPSPGAPRRIARRTG